MLATLARGPEFGSVSACCTGTLTRSRASRSVRSAPRSHRRAETRRSGSGRVGRAGHYPARAAASRQRPAVQRRVRPHRSDCWRPAASTDIILWSVAHHAEQGMIRDASGAITSVAYSPRGNLLAAGGSDGTVLLRNTVTVPQDDSMQVPSRGLVRSIAFSPHGRRARRQQQQVGGAVRIWPPAARIGQPLTGRVGKCRLRRRV